MWIPWSVQCLPAVYRFPHFQPWQQGVLHTRSGVSKTLGCGKNSFHLGVLVSDLLVLFRTEINNPVLIIEFSFLEWACRAAPVAGK